MNNAGQVVGFSSISTTRDPTGFSFIGGPIHPFLWQNGVSQDLGTLGGPDAIAFNNCNNQRANLVTGVSLLADSVTLHPFLWHNGRMTDLGTLGGSFPGEQFGSFIPSQCANDAGKVSGSWTLPGDLIIHAFLWEGGIMRDLGTLGGDNSLALWMNEAGDVVGQADLQGDQTHHAFLWRNGVMTDLGSLGGTSRAIAINSKGQIVGKSRQTPVETELQHAFLWENGGPMVDLNTLIGPNSPLELYDGENINDAGWIAGRGLPPGCGNKDQCGHAFLLIPCHPASGQDCSPVTAIAPQDNAAVPNKQTTRSAQLPLTPPQSLATRGVQLPQRYRFRGVTTSKD